MIAAELKRVRLSLGLGPVAMAEYLHHTPYTTYWRWEAGRNRIPRWVAPRCEVLKQNLKTQSGAGAG